MKIGPVLCWLSDYGDEVPKEQAKEVIVRVTMDDNDEILKEKDIIPDAFSVVYTIENDFCDLLNEGVQVHSWALTDEESKQIGDYIKHQMK